jgi:pimeloyl-ACP methyl ester carboxylesterase
MSDVHHAIDGAGKPLVYLLPAHAHLGSKTFGAIPGHMTIAIDHLGATSIEAWASDVVALLKQLGITRADFLGQSFGGAVATMIALRHPELVDRVATYGATFGPPAEAHDARMLHFDAPPTPNDRAFAHLRKSHPSWLATWEKTARIVWNGFSKEDLRALTTPMLLLVGDRDFVKIEHVVDTFRLLPNAELAVLPDAGHFALFSEPERVLPIVTHFFDKPALRPPVATAAIGWHPGETR